MKQIIKLLKTVGQALEAPEDFTPAELATLKGDLGLALADLETDNMTGLMVSLDDGENWVSTDGIRVMYHDAIELDDGMADLLVNLTTEGIILDLADQGSGEVTQTASLMIEDLVGLTR